MAEPRTERLDLTADLSLLALPPRGLRPGRRYHHDALVWPEPKRRRAYAWVTVGAVTAVIMARAVVQLRRGEVTGLDTGNWLTLGHHWLGQGVSGSGSTYPPLVPVLAALLGYVASPMVILVVLGMLGSLVYAGAAALVLWHAKCGWWSVPLVLLLAAGTASGEAVAWGGIPQLIGLGLGLGVLYLAAELIIRPRPRPSWLLGVLTLALGATSHLLLAVTAAAAALMLCLRLTWALPRPSRAGLRQLAGAGLRALIPCLLLVPLYLQLLSTVGQSFAQRESGQDRADFFSAVDDVIRELPGLGRSVIVFCLLAPLLLWRERRRPLWLVTAALSVLLTLLTGLSPEPRFAYVVPIQLVCALGLIASAGPLTRQPALRLTGIGLALSIVGTCIVHALTIFPGQVQYYGALVPQGTESALRALRSTTRTDDVVLVPPVKGLPFGWWIEGYGKRAAYAGSSAEWLNFPRERERARVSVDLFSSTDALSDTWFKEVAADGIDVVYLPATYDGVSATQWKMFERRHPELVLYANAAALIVRVR